MFVTITLTAAAISTGPFDLYSDADGYVTPVDTNVPKSSLLTGYTISVSDLSTIIRVQSVGTCTNYIDLTIANIPSPTPTATVTNTPTQTPTPTPTPAPPPDADATAYLNAVVAAGGTVTSLQSGATYNMFGQLKANGLYSKLYAFYPFLSSTQAAQAINAKNPGTHTMSFIGSGNQFNSNGYYPSDGSSYASFTSLTSGLFGTGGNLHLSLYITLPATGSDSGYDLNTADSNNSNQNYCFAFSPGAKFYYSFVGSYTTSVSNGSTPGYYLTTFDPATSTLYGYKNGSSVAVNTGQSYYLPTNNFYLAVEVAGIGTFGGKNTKTYGFATFGNTLTPSESVLLSNIVNQWQTDLGRNVY
jgi:hypothetical protein